MSRFFQVSARDHGALILMTALADAGDFVRLQAIADEMRISQGYLEEIAATLKKAGLIQGKQGPGGGYRLAKPAAEISLEEILTALEGPIELVECQGSHAICPVAEKCSSKSIWNVLQRTLKSALRDITLASLQSQ